MVRLALAFSALLLLQASIQAQATGNLLRNGAFQDDWITMLPQTKNHHWCFSSEFYNRRDYNPDAWYCKGSWDWQNADAPWGERRMVVTGPAELYQRVNWIAIHDDRQLEGFPDAGGFPVMKAASSTRPERLVRDLTFRVKLAGTDVPKDGGQLHIGLCPPSGTSTADPMGVRVPALAYASLTLPEGTFASKWFEVKLSAADWLKAASRAAKNAKELPLPASVSVAINYYGKTGKLDIDRAELLAAKSDAPNLLKNGGFEELDKNAYPIGWSKPSKYTYFPPRHYYIFNTWHNTGFPNRGSVELDALLPHSGKHSLRMIVPAGDETCVVSDAIVLNQKEPRLIEVSAWIKTDRLCMLQIDGHDEKGNRLDGFNFIHKAPVSIGTDEWRMIRQVFRPRTPVQAFKLVLAARGVNGYTLDGTGSQPQNNVVGTIWWDDVRVHEPEASATELQERGVKPVVEAEVKSGVRIMELDLGERLFGANTLRAVVHNPGPAKKMNAYIVVSKGLGKPTILGSAAEQLFPVNTDTVVTIPYEINSGADAYEPWTAMLAFQGQNGKEYATTEIAFGIWANPIKLDLGALYLQPEQKQLVRMNLGISRASLAKLKSVRLEVLGRGNGKVLKTSEVDASPKALLAQRAKIPAELRDDLANLLLADIDVGFLPVQPFANPERNWIIRASAIGTDGKVMNLGTPNDLVVDSQPFCRLAHDAPQPAIKDVAIKNGMTYVNGQPWIPFGVTYGHNAVYDGPADPGPGKYRDLHNLPGWSMYDRHNSNSSNRKQYDFNCMRYVAGSITKLDALEKRWKDDNLYCSSAFSIPQPAFTLDDYFKLAGGKDKLDAYLASCGKSPMVVSIAPGIEEAFGLFQGATPAQLKGLQTLVEYTRKQSGRPVMVGHGGYWNRLEFEKVPFFDIFDPETEPLYPANIHTDFTPIIKGKDKVLWLRPQMYESVPYERWRFHTYVELMRGCRGWQIAHGPGDASLFRGLHGELEFWKPIVASTEAPPSVKTESWIEHKAWKHQGKTYLIAATTHAIPLGSWQPVPDAPERFRLTEGKNELRDESNAFGIGGAPESGYPVHGLQYFPDARIWPAGTNLRQMVKLDEKSLPKGIAILVKADGRWTHAATWGKFDLTPLRNDPKTAYWFLNTHYRHAKGFLGWGNDLVPKSLDYIPAKAKDMGALPKPGELTPLEFSLEDVGAAGKLVDGVAFMHDGGRVVWELTSLLPRGGPEHFLGERVRDPNSAPGATKVHVAGLQKDARIRVLFEDRDIVSKAGYFEDDFRGQDLYQRYGGATGYGNAPVALHLYEIARP